MTKEEVLIKPLRDKTLIEEMTNYIDLYGIKSLMELAMKAIDNSKNE